MTAKSSQIAPSGTYNHVGVDFLSPKTAAQNIAIVDAPTGGSTFSEFDVSTPAFKIDTINEYTSATGVTIDSVLLKDSQVGANSSNCAKVYSNEFYLGDGGAASSNYVIMSRDSATEFRFYVTNNAADVTLNFANTSASYAAIMKVEKIQIGSYTIEEVGDTLEISVNSASTKAINFINDGAGSQEYQLAGSPT